MFFQHHGIGDSKSIKQARDMDIPEIWKYSPGINPYPGNGGNRWSFSDVDTEPYISSFEAAAPYYYHSEVQ